MAAHFLVSPPHLLLVSRPTAKAISTSPPVLRLSSRGRTRGLRVVTRAGPPSTNTYIFAFLFPLSMLVGTILTSIKIDLKLDQDFLEELAIEEARMEVDGEEGSDISIKKEPALPSRKSEAPRSRNRPKREA